MKHWYHSKTIWFNVATVAVAVIAVALEYVGKIGLAPEHEALASMVLVGVNTVGNIVLRTVTNAAIR